MNANSNTPDESTSIDTVIAARGQDRLVMQHSSIRQSEEKTMNNTSDRTQKIPGEKSMNIVDSMGQLGEDNTVERRTLRYVLERQGGGPSFEAQLYINRIPKYLPEDSEFQKQLENCQDGTLLLNLATTFYQPLEEVSTIKALFEFRNYFFNHEGSYNFTFAQFVRVYPIISCLMVKSKGQREKVKCPRAFVSESRCRMDTSHRTRTDKTRSKKPKLECYCRVNYRIEIDMQEKLVTILAKGLHTHPIENVLAFKTSAFLVNILDDLCRKGHKNVNQIQSIMKKQLSPYDWETIGFSQMLSTRSHFTNRLAKFHPPNGIAKGFEPGTIVITQFESDKHSIQQEEHAESIDASSSNGGGATPHDTHSDSTNSFLGRRLGEDSTHEVEELHRSITRSLRKIQDASLKLHQLGDINLMRRISRQLTTVTEQLGETHYSATR